MWFGREAVWPYRYYVTCSFSQMFITIFLFLPHSTRHVPEGNFEPGTFEHAPLEPRRVT